ncbi:phage integrase central domain-containing protein [Sphaerotilus sulfidivorans]
MLQFWSIGAAAFLNLRTPSVQLCTHPIGAASVRSTKECRRRPRCRARIGASSVGTCTSSSSRRFPVLPGYSGIAPDRPGLPQVEDTLPTGAALHALTAHLSSIPARKLRRCAAAYIKAHREGWKNPKHAAQWQSTLEQYAGPVIGDCNRGLQDDFRADPQTSSSRGSRPPSAT